MQSDEIDSKANFSFPLSFDEVKETVTQRIRKAVQH
jgi:hypothetical protein